MKYVCKAAIRNTINKEQHWPHNACVGCLHNIPHEIVTDKVPYHDHDDWNCVVHPEIRPNCQCIPIGLEYYMREAIKKHEENKDG